MFWTPQSSKCKSRPNQDEGASSNVLATASIATRKKARVCLDAIAEVFVAEGRGSEQMMSLECLVVAVFAL